ncbi:MAG: TatD family hydrolase [Rickettsiales bacterium]|jgi:TatD DNase family protein|nr:TatD family hydrolase [Rickettsiales bacterium]
MFVDSHCHVDFAPPEERRGIIARAVAAGVGVMLNVSASRQSWDDAVGLANSDTHVFAAVGVHPEEVEDAADLVPAEKILSYLKSSKKIVAIGETGLDYHYENFDGDLQEANFRAHIGAARAAGLPVIIHNRDSDADMLRILADEMKRGAFKGVLHCFSSDENMARAVLDMGLVVSASGIITFPKAEALRAVFGSVPLGKILIETDSPFLAPVPNRGKPNEPAFVVEVAKKLAEIKDVPLAEIERATTKNFKEYFGLGGLGGP